MPLLLLFSMLTSFAVLYAVLVFDVCNNQNELLQQSLRSMRQLKLADNIDLLLHCGQDNVTSFFEVLGFDNVLEVQSMVLAQQQRLESQRDMLESTSSFVNIAQESLADFEVDKSQVNYTGEEGQLWSVFDDTEGLIPDAEDYENYGFNITEFDIRIDETNTITIQAFGLFYIRQNVSTINVQESPFNETLSDYEKVVVDEAASMGIDFDLVDEERREILESITRIMTLLAETSMEIRYLESLLLAMNGNVVALSEAFDSLLTLVSARIVPHIDFISSLLSDVALRVSVLPSTASCLWVSSWYVTNEPKACVGTTWSAVGLAVACAAGTLLWTAIHPLNLIATKRFRHGFNPILTYGLGHDNPLSSTIPHSYSFSTFLPSCHPHHSSHIGISE